MKTYSPFVMKAVRQQMGVEPDDTSLDSEIMAMTEREVFEKWLYWHGIIGYSYNIIEAISDIYKVELDY